MKQFQTRGENEGEESFDENEGAGENSISGYSETRTKQRY